MATIDELTELMHREEELDPELVPYLQDSELFGRCLKHPLVFSIVHPPQMNAWANAQLKQKKEALREAKAAENWATVVWLHERPYRINAFMSICWHLDGPAYWELLGKVWTDAENQWQDRDAWTELLQADPEGRELMSSEGDARSVFELTPEQGGLLPMTRVYRGYCHDDGLDGCSWTLDKARARWFATRLRQDDDPPAKIASGLVAREHVIAYITDRDEAEIVCLPEHVTELTVQEV